MQNLSFGSLGNSGKKMKRIGPLNYPERARVSVVFAVEIKPDTLVRAAKRHIVRLTASEITVKVTSLLERIYVLNLFTKIE